MSISHDIEKIQSAKILYENGQSIASIAKSLKIDRHRLSRELKELGVSVSRTSSKYTYNEDWFKHIDTEEKAYWLGFLYADGYISPKSDFMELGLKKSDEHHVAKLRNSLSPNKPLQFKDKNSSVLYKCTNVNIAKDLVRHGCVPRKTFILTFPDSRTVPEDLVRHFIRGYFDGDGCINISKDRGQTAISVIGNEVFIKHLKNHVENHLPITSTTMISKGKVVEWRKTGKDAHIILDYMYKDSTVYLDRKHEIYATILPS